MEDVRKINHDPLQMWLCDDAILFRARFLEGVEDVIHIKRFAEQDTDVPSIKESLELVTEQVEALCKLCSSREPKEKRYALRFPVYDDSVKIPRIGLLIPSLYRVSERLAFNESQFKMN